MYHAGAGGREVVEKTFENIRQRAIRGHIARAERRARRITVCEGPDALRFEMS